MQDNSKGGQGEEPQGKTGEGLSPEELYKAGTEQFRLRRYDLARASFELYLEEKPGDPEACHILARVLYLQGKDLDKAEMLLRDALALSPPNQSRYLGTLAEIYLVRGKYAKAQTVLEFALSNDPKDDKRHTAALEYHLELVRKKLKAEAAGKEEGAGDDRPPIFLATQMDRWQERRKQVLFLLPSVIAHTVVLLFVGFLSTHELPFKKETREDFTYIEVGQEAPPIPSEEARPIGERPAPAQMPEAPQAGRMEEAPAPAPAAATPRKEVSAAGVERQAGRATGEASLNEPGAAGMRGPVGEKAATGLPSGGEPGEIVALSRAAPDKGVDVNGAKRGGRESEPDLVRKSLGGAKATGSQAGRKEASVRGLNERSGAQAAKAGEGIFLGAGKPESGAKWEKEKLVDIKGRPGEAEPKAAPGATEKTFALNTPNRRTSALSSGPGEPSGLAAPSLGIGVSGMISPARSATGGGTPGSVERSEAAATGAGVGIAPSSQAGGPGIGGAKARGSLGEYGTEPGGPSGSWGSERRAEFPGQSAGRSFASAEAVPGRRGLDIPSAGLRGAVERGQAQGGPGNTGRESFASPGRSEGTATGGVSGSALITPGQTSGGPGYAPGAGKSVNSRALGSGGQEGIEGEGFFERAAKKVTAALGMGGGRGTGGGEADIRRGGRLSGLAGAAGGGTGNSGTGAGAGGSGRGTGGVRVASAEKGSTGAGTGAGTLSPAPGQGGMGLSGTKRMAEGVLGVPGGTSAEKYASAGRGNVRPGALEKQSGVGRARYMAKASLGPVVTITTPSPGRTYQLSQVIGGTVSDTRTRQATLTVNNDSRVISVEQGSFEAVVSLSRGRNIITVTAFDMDGNVGKDTITLDYVEPSAGPPVNIVSPRDGQVFDVSEKSAITVRGTIGDQDIKRAKLIFNGNPRDISVNRGYFEQQVALVQERNTILAEAVSRDGQVSRSQLVTVNTVNVRPKDISIILTWDKPRADMDLHVYGPQGGHTSYKTPNPYESREAIPGAQLEQDAKGNFGPEVFTQERAEKGIYTVKSNYYYSGGDGNAHSTVTVILYGDNPSRRIVRVFGPHLQVDTKNGEDTWEVTKFKMPEGKFLED